MTATELLPLLDEVRPRNSGKWISQCPAHPDKSPSLAIAEGNRGLLLKCWADCSLAEICSVLGIKAKDLFFDDLGTDWRKRKALAEAGMQRRYAEASATRKEGRRLDALRHADDVMHSRRTLARKAKA